MEAFNPNMITLTGLGMALLGSREVWHRRYITGAALMWARYFLDKTYRHQESPMGECLDHISDMTTATLFGAAIVYDLPDKVRPWYIGAAFVMAILMTTDVGCQKVLLGKQEPLAERWMFWAFFTAVLGYLQFSK